ncbi:MAG: hypothetical protein AAF772_10430 [Acidobacteriota bacterium]
MQELAWLVAQEHLLLATQSPLNKILESHEADGADHGPALDAKGVTTALDPNGLPVSPTFHGLRILAQPTALLQSTQVQPQREQPVRIPVFIQGNAGVIAVFQPDGLQIDAPKPLTAWAELMQRDLDQQTLAVEGDRIAMRSIAANAMRAIWKAHKASAEQGVPYANAIAVFNQMFPQASDLDRDNLMQMLLQDGYLMQHEDVLIIQDLYRLPMSAMLNGETVRLDFMGLPANPEQPPRFLLFLGPANNRFLYAETTYGDLEQQGHVPQLGDVPNASGREEMIRENKVLILGRLGGEVLSQTLNGFLGLAA